MTDFFSNVAGIEVASYPARPGYKREGTSKLAAESVNAPTLRDRVLGVLKDFGSLTPDEIARTVGLPITSIRPRCSELLRLGKIKETSERRPNASGKMAQVLAIV